MCLVAEPSSAMRDLMLDVINDAGFETLQAESAAEVADHVHLPKLLSAETMLLVLGASWAAQCAMTISVAATQRHHLGLQPTQLILVYEWGTLGVVDRPALHHCETVAVLEKPFEMEALGDVVRIVRYEAVERA